MTLDLHGEALRTADVEVVDRQIHAVAGQVSTQRLDRREHRGHAGLVLNLLEQLLADQERLDAFLDDLGSCSTFGSPAASLIPTPVVNPPAPAFLS